MARRKRKSLLVWALQQAPQLQARLRQAPQERAPLQKDSPREAARRRGTTSQARQELKGKAKYQAGESKLVHIELFLKDPYSGPQTHRVTGKGEATPNYCNYKLG